MLFDLFFDLLDSICTAFRAGLREFRRLRRVRAYANLKSPFEG